MATTAKSDVRRNRYGGYCDTCSAWIGAGDGQLLSIDGKWRVRHLEVCPPRARRSGDVPQEPPTLEGAESLPAKGYYAVSGKRYRVDAPKDGKWAGYVFVKTGSHYHEQKRIGMYVPEVGWRGSERGALVLADVISDPEGRMADYGKITGRCGRCHAVLEDETSRELGLGPVCRTYFN